MATDLAEFLGAAVGFSLLFGIPLFPAGVLTGITTFLILSLQRYGFRALEAVIIGFVSIISICYVAETILGKPDFGATAGAILAPRFSGTESILLASGILGATVMPHVIYLHSALTQRRVVGRSDEERRRIFRFERVDVIIAMGIAGVINMSMLVMAAAVFHDGGLTHVQDIDEVFHRLGDLVGSNAQYAFGAALLASGLSSSSVGTLAGQVVMQGFIDRQIPLWLRRGITMAPALIVLAIGVNPSRALVLSQVVLSFGIPFALIPLVLFCRDRRLMGSLVNRPATTAVAAIVAALIVGLNAVLLIQTLG
jgi:manganese transport protein